MVSIDVSGTKLAQPLQTQATRNGTIRPIENPSCCEKSPPERGHRQVKGYRVSFDPLWFGEHHLVKALAVL